MSSVTFFFRRLVKFHIQLCVVNLFSGKFHSSKRGIAS